MFHGYWKKLRITFAYVPVTQEQKQVLNSEEIKIRNHIKAKIPNPGIHPDRFFIWGMWVVLVHKFKVTIEWIKECKNLETASTLYIVLVPLLTFIYIFLPKNYWKIFPPSFRDPNAWDTDSQFHTDCEEAPRTVFKFLDLHKLFLVMLRSWNSWVSDIDWRASLLTPIK